MRTWKYRVSAGRTWKSLFTPNLTPTLRGSTRATVFALFLELTPNLTPGFRKLTLCRFFYSVSCSAYAKPYATLARAYAMRKCSAKPITPNLTPTLRGSTRTTVFALVLELTPNLTPCLREPTRTQGWQDTTKQSPRRS